MTAARQAASRNPQARARLTAEEILDPSLPCLILATIVVRGHDARQRHSSEIARALRVSRALVCSASTDAARKNSAQSHDVVSKVEEVLFVQAVELGAHHRIFARAFAKIAQLQIEVARRLAGQNWERADHGISVCAVTRSAALGLGFARCGVLRFHRARRRCQQHHKKYEYGSSQLHRSLTKKK